MQKGRHFSRSLAHRKRGCGLPLTCRKLTEIQMLEEATRHVLRAVRIHEGYTDIDIHSEAKRRRPFSQWNLPEFRQVLTGHEILANSAAAGEKYRGGQQQLRLPSFPCGIAGSHDDTLADAAIAQHARATNQPADAAAQRINNSPGLRQTGQEPTGGRDAAASGLDPDSSRSRNR